MLDMYKRSISTLATPLLFHAGCLVMVFCRQSGKGKSYKDVLHGPTGAVSTCQLDLRLLFNFLNSCVQPALAHKQLLCAVRNMKLFLRVRFDVFISLATSKTEIWASPSPSAGTENYSEYLPAAQDHRISLKHLNFPSVNFLMFWYRNQ